MKINNGDALHLVLFGTTNEGKYFLQEFRDKFDLVGFNANMIAYSPEFMALFISKLSNKTFFIDPQTYAFQQPTKTLLKKSNGKLVPKKSLLKLAQIYGSKILELIGKDSLDPALLSDTEIKLISGSVLTFQKSFVQSNISEEIREFLEGEIIQPAFLISPYFYMQADNITEVLRANVKFIEESKKLLEADDKLYAEIAISQEVLNDPVLCNNLETHYQSAAVDGYVLWIDNFSELEATEYLLNRFKHFIRSLSSSKRPIIMLHGSYLSIVFSSMHFKYLAAVGHGIEYGENRALVPVGGGVPTAKFYFPKYHQRIKYDSETQDILLEMNWIKSRKTFLENVCDCDICKSLIIDDDVVNHFITYGETKLSEKNDKLYPTGKALDLSRRHYLTNKIIEYKKLNSLTLDEIVNDLGVAQEEVNKFKTVLSINHLARWKNVILQ